MPPLLALRGVLVKRKSSLLLTGPKPKEIKVETFRINYLIRSPKVEKLGFEPVSLREGKRAYHWGSPSYPFLF